MSANDLILDRFQFLSPKLQIAARFVVDHPNEVVTVSMRTLADRAEVQPATLVRLAQHLGFTGWPELKRSFVEELGLGLQADRYSHRAKSLAVRGPTVDLLREMFAVQKENLDATELHCSSSLREAVKKLKRARIIHIAGFRASFPIAYSMAYGYQLFRDEVKLIDGLAGGLEMQLRYIQKRDVVVAISFAPYSREALTVIDAAKAAGATILALTDSNASPLALAADLAILFSANSPSFFPSVAAAVAAAEALLELVVADAGNDVVRKIDEAEQKLIDSGAYVPVAAKRLNGKR